MCGITLHQYLICWEFSWLMYVKFCKEVFLHLLRWSHDLHLLTQMYYNDWFAHVQSSLHHWDKSHLVMVYLFLSYAAEFSFLSCYWKFLHLCVSGILTYNCFLMMSLLTWFSMWCWPYNLEVFFLQEFKKDWYFSLNVQ